MDQRTLRMIHQTFGWKKDGQWATDNADILQQHGSICPRSDYKNPPKISTVFPTAIDCGLLKDGAPIRMIYRCESCGTILSEK